jgi:hypothetical protein
VLRTNNISYEYMWVRKYAYNNNRESTIRRKRLIEPIYETIQWSVLWCTCIYIVLLIMILYDAVWQRYKEGKSHQWKRKYKNKYKEANIQMRDDIKCKFIYIWYCLWWYHIIYCSCTLKDKCNNDGMKYRIINEIITNMCNMMININ